MEVETPTAPYPPIGDYALIGNCRSAALISRDGSLDWLCWPRFDSAALFAALLDRRQGGLFQIRPTGPYQVERRYRLHTNILETTFRTPCGTVLLSDLMPVSSEADWQAALAPEHEVVREITGIDGVVEMEIIYAPRPRYGEVRPTLLQHGPLGIWCDADGALLVLNSEVGLQVGGDQSRATGKVLISGGQRRSLSLSYSRTGPAVIPPLGSVAATKIAQTEQWWRKWAGRCSYDGPYRAAVERSALTLKLLTYAPSGAVIAAPTTSLPEQIGGGLNWDYRYCWLRDAFFTLRALDGLGYQEEAAAFRHWILHATRLTRPELQVVYSVFGEAHLPERNLEHLEGYAGSRPVRVGNGAHSQLQLDVYGQVIDGIIHGIGDQGAINETMTRFLVGLGETVCRRWREPDDGIWEPRSRPAHHTHSKVLCWVALDRLIKLHEAGRLELPADRFCAERDAIRRAVEIAGYNERLGSYTGTFHGDDLDASLLVLPLYGYIAADHPRMRSTLDRVRTTLGRGSLIFRNQGDVPHGSRPGQGAFGLCSFWAVECLARAGNLHEARRTFEALLGYANDVGLLGEEIDPETGAVLGNFPQAFTHIGLITAALSLEECSERIVEAQPPAGCAQR